MKDPIYFYRTVSGKTHFTTGAVKADDKLGEYIRMLRFAKYPVVQLHLDNAEDFDTICNRFIIHGKTWQDVYNEV